jgi:hypothetical protein
MRLPHFYSWNSRHTGSGDPPVLPRPVVHPTHELARTQSYLYHSIAKRTRLDRPGMCEYSSGALLF